jgi:hypothetical protein
VCLVWVLMVAIQEDERGIADPKAIKRDLPAQDPGAAFEPEAWSGKVGKRG